MRRAIVLSRVSTLQQDLRQQTEEILREVYKDGYKKEEVIVIEDKESAIKLSEEERRGLNKLKEHIRTDPTITAVYIYELSRLSRRQLVLFSIRDFLIEHNIQLIYLKPYFRLLEPDGKMSQTGSLMFSIFSSMSESEMALVKERMMRGRKQYIEKCRREGIKMGRPETYRKSIEEYKKQYQKEISLIRKGLSLANISAITGTSINTIRKVRILVREGRL